MATAELLKLAINKASDLIAHAQAEMCDIAINSNPVARHGLMDRAAMFAVQCHRFMGNQESEETIRKMIGEWQTDERMPFLAAMLVVGGAELMRIAAQAELDARPIT